MNLLRIRSASAVGGTTLRLTLSDGAVIERDVRRLLEGPLLAPLRASPSEFARVRAEDGTASWPSGAELCPDVLIWGGRPPVDPAAKPPAFLAVPDPSARDAQSVAEEPDPDSRY